ncbi:hypothetical protein B0H13DRAFT_2308109 [Mycena leptocephala]|nr:hypothetical protein B0H13DRAFT_2308109 [Mycena leptocephala]
MFALRRVIPIVTAFLAAAMAASASGDVAFPGPPEITLASWMWTTDTSNTAFPLANISVTISADNAYALYFNGSLIGNGLDWKTPNVWTINNVPSHGPWGFAILATNYYDVTAVNPAGIIASFRASNDALQEFYIWYTGQIAIPSVVWKAMDAVPEGFESPPFDDSAWPPAVIEAL